MGDIDRRSLIGAAAALGYGQAPVGAGASPGAAPSGAVRVAATRDELRARGDLRPGDVVRLVEPGREGVFIGRAGPPPVADRLEGLFVRARGFHFARAWDGTHGRPEWFGARVDDWRFDCADAIEACYALCPHTQLAQADYFIRRTLRFDRSWRTVRGVGNFATDQGRGTRIILQGQAPGVHTDDIVLVGSLRQPGPTNERFPYENHLSNFTIIRDGRSAPHPSGDLRRYPAGLRASFVVRCTFREISSLESGVGFYFGGVTYTKVDDCLAQRLQPGAGPRGDLAAGYYLDGAPEFGMAGGNASLYMHRCVAVGQHPSHVRPTGLVAEGAFVDSFVDWFESAGIDNGMTWRVAGATARGRTVDVHIRNPVLDGCGRYALELDLTGTATASIEITDPYVHAAGAGGEHGVVVHDGSGLVTVTGGQIHGAFRGGSLHLARTRGVRVQGLKIHEAVRPVVVDRSGGLVLEPQITNAERRTDAFAVEARGMYRSLVRPTVVGSPGAFAGGVSLDAGVNYSQFDGTTVDPGCFAEVTGARKLWFAGADATRGPAAAAFQRASNVVTGVIG